MQKKRSIVQGTTTTPTGALAEFAACLRYDDIPEVVVARSVDFFVDWLGSALAGKGQPPVEAIAAFANQMGPQSGACEVFLSRGSTSPYFAALVNGAASHIAEQDDVHNGSVFHPAAVVFPAALATAQSIKASGREFLAAVTAGYEIGIRVGEFLGRSHYKTFHTTGTAGTFAAAAAVGRLLDLSPISMLHAFGSAGTQSAGLWEFLRDAADSKPLHAGKASANGLLSAYLANDGFTGAKLILEGKQGLGAAMSTDANPEKLTEGFGSRWALAETSFKLHASCRHTHPAADALLKAMKEHSLTITDIVSATAKVHQSAIDVLGSVVEPTTVHQAKFSMGTTLGLIAAYGRAGVLEFEHGYANPDVVEFRRRVDMEIDEEVDAAYPARWIGKIKVTTKDGRQIESRVDEPKGDPGNALSRQEIETKILGLAETSKACTPAEITLALPRLWDIASTNRIGRILPLDGTL